MSVYSALKQLFVYIYIYYNNGTAIRDDWSSAWDSQRSRLLIVLSAPQESASPQTHLQSTRWQWTDKLESVQNLCRKIYRGIVRWSVTRQAVASSAKTCSSLSTASSSAIAVFTTSRL